MIYITNLNNQLNLTYDTRKDVYAFDSIKSVSFSWDTNGDYYVIINFIANDKNNSLRIYLKDVDPTILWVNTFAGATLAVKTIASWMNEVIEVSISAANDSIGIYGYNGATPTPVFVNASGQVAVQGLYGEDSAHASTNSGMFVMGVRNDSNAVMTNADGDYSPIAVSNKGAVAINDGGNSITVDGGTGSLRTTGIIRPTGSGNVSSVAANFFSVSVANVGAADGDVLGGTNNIKPGEVLNFSADAINNFFNSFAYDATGTEFIIIYVA